MRIPSKGIRRLALMALVVGAAALSSAPGPGLTKRDKAFFKDAAIVNFVRPGLVLKIQSVSIASDRTIQANFTITDPQGLPLDRLGINTPGAVGVSFVVGTIPKGQTQYIDYATRQVTSADGKTTATQGTADSGGVFVANADGSYKYTFGTKAPAGYDTTATHTVAAYSNRNLTSFDMGTQYSNDVFTWVPSGAAVTVVRDVVETASCNQCHDPLSAHGGSRQVVALCIMCHNPQSSDPNTGNTIDFKVMVHKIHMGSSLPSVVAGGTYQIVGFQNAVSDFSTVVFPSDVRRCTICHTPTATQANNYITKASRAACGSCHDDVNFTTGVNHAGGPQFDDNQCTICHIAQGELEFDASILGGHTIPTESKSLPGTTFTMVKVDNGSAGKSPTVTFTLKDKTGNPIPASTMNSLSLILAGPTSDYPSEITESAITKASCGNDGTCVYTFAAVIPAKATGTFTIGIEGYKNITILPGTTVSQVVRDYGQNKVINFSVDTSPVTPRRTVVAIANCNQCHTALAVHGGMRNQIEQCVLCHNPNATDSPVRPATAGAAQGINFTLMIHKIHSGTSLTTDYTIYGFGASVNNFNGVRFPGDLTDCAKCHVNSSNEIPIAAVLPVVSPRGPINPILPIAAACTACHDTIPVASHALTNTSTLGEACVTCHDENGDFAVSKVHAH
jgi:OmcA/MtrC family decaheme c-type cytochrome